MDKRQNAVYECDKCSKHIVGIKAYYIWQHRKQQPLRKGYCSQECSRLGNIKDRIQLICRCCDKNFEKLSSDVVSKNNFCSRKCSATYNNSVKSLSRAKIKISKQSVQKQISEKFAIKVKNKCLGCDNFIEKYPHETKMYCSVKCQKTFEYQQRVKVWKTTGVSPRQRGQISAFIKRYLLEKYNNRCSRCEWNEINPVTGKSPLETEHLDGNSENNREDNLTILCPNCHSLTPTYRALNKGNGRHERRNRYKQGKSF